MIDIIAYMEGWARWRANGRVIPRQSSTSMTGKIMAGMRSTVCPMCRGECRTLGQDGKWIDPCPLCRGWGKVSGNLSADPHTLRAACAACGGYKDKCSRKIVRGTGELHGKTCTKCGGEGIRTHVFEQANPAAIRATRYVGANEDDDPISMMIDRTVAGWSQIDTTWWLHAIVITEYASGGTQQMKAAKRDISAAFYCAHLKRAHAIVEEKLTVML